MRPSRVPIPVLLAVLLLAACAGEPTADVAAGGDGEAPAAAPIDAGALTVLDPAIVPAVEAMQARVLEPGGDYRAYETIESLTTEVGPRLAGSAGDRRAVAWAEARLRALGFGNVRTEPVTVPHWQRGDAYAAIVAPHPQPMVVTALGGSVGTPPGGIEAEVLRVGSLPELQGLSRGRVAGKIVFIDEEMERTETGAGYGRAVAKRVAGPDAAARLGAVALVIRSVGTSTDRIAHTGTTRYSDELPRIPAAALSNPDADLLRRQLALGGPVRLRLDLGCQYLPDVESANVIGEVVGSEHPEEIVLLVAHLDAWDLGTGAIDDGSGVGIVTEAARQIMLAATPPRRTVRVLLTANEEFGLSGARAYTERYAVDLGQHVAGLESDFGADRVIAFRSRVAEADLPLVRDVHALLAPLAIPYQGNQARGGADLSPLRPKGVPVFDLSQDGTRYFDYHHTVNDTLDKIDPDHLRHNVAAYATAAYALATAAERLGPAPVEE